VEMVGREDLPNAIALNSTGFNTARAAGPAVGGLLMRSMGLAGCFFVNAFSFVFVIIGLLLQRLPPHEPAPRNPGLQEFREGFLFVRRHETLWLVTLIVAFVSTFGMSFMPLVPIFARDIYGSDERGFSLLLTCNGLGALGSSFTLAAAGDMRHRGKRLLLGAFLFCLSVVAFGAVTHLVPGCICLFFVGWFLLTFLTTANTIVQTLAPDALRGRVFSIYSLALIGTAPIGQLLIGTAAKYLGPRLAVQIGAELAAAFILLVYLRVRQLWKEK
jgi:predicted MFS family arabinose efflux permease